MLFIQIIFKGINQIILSKSNIEHCYNKSDSIDCEQKIIVHLTVENGANGEEEKMDFKYKSLKDNLDQ